MFANDVFFVASFLVSMNMCAEQIIFHCWDIHNVFCTDLLDLGRIKLILWGFASKGKGVGQESTYLFSPSFIYMTIVFELEEP